LAAGLAAGLLLGAGCRATSPTDQATLILVSFDGFRWDYPDRVPTPNLDRLAQRGVRARQLVPVFPTETFPNHYTIVTGLYPEHHGIVSNTMYDSGFDATFALDRAESRRARWWSGEPIWLTARHHGLRTAAYFWPGTAVPIHGEYPDRWRRYDGSIPYEARIDTVLKWLDGPIHDRPRLVTLYFELLDDVGHAHDVTGPEVDSAIVQADHLVGRLVRGLEARGLIDRVDLLIVADHGMTNRSPERAIFLDDYIDLSWVDVIHWSPQLAMRPAPGRRDTALAQLRDAHPALHVYPRNATPARWHYRTHRRLPAIVGVADPGWTITTHDAVRRNPALLHGGAHGYDPAVEAMRAVFIGAGPGLRSGVRVDSVLNVDLYVLMCRLLDIPPAPNDGDARRIASLLSP